MNCDVSKVHLKRGYRSKILVYLGFTKSSSASQDIAAALQVESFVNQVHLRVPGTRLTISFFILLKWNFSNRVKVRKV
jgi:hypothetical protein